ncbi:hypothetical protein PGTUg99_007065 [Puccinia graminis f. sp. tritici]|uniref:Uncharacterized protein n=1 Tax=Puccinia graminis f. sp. tritici TaxID=56615 RepID=A0A5B0S8V2_PUCGR|nr:hypothetical protein PGTUg99_007065 [Puccinia graminis f. sp. tritici]
MTQKPYQLLIAADSNPTMSNTDQSKVTLVKTDSKAILASEGTRSEPNKATKPVKTVVKKAKKQIRSPEEVPSEWDESNLSLKSEKPKSAATVVKKQARNTKKKLTKTAKSNDPVPNTDPFKSNDKVSKLIDKDSISQLSFKKLNREPLAKTIDNAARTLSEQAPSANKLAVQVDPVSEAAKTLLNGPKIFNEPVD